MDNITLSEPGHGQYKSLKLKSRRILSDNNIELYKITNTNKYSSFW